MHASKIILISAAALYIAAGCTSPVSVPGPIDGGDGDTTEVEWVLVPGGEFRMGSPAPAYDPDEAPVHTVKLDSFYISRFEVTNSLYAKFLSDSTTSATHWNANMEIIQEGGKYRAKLRSDNLPVNYVTWDDAAAFAAWIGGRLPTEAEWEKAARGTSDTRIFPWGNSISYGLANFYSNEGLWNVGRATGESPYGCRDMAGNVWEWTTDWYDWRYYTYSPYENPTGPVTGDYRVIRGGGFQNEEMQVRCAERRGYPPHLREIDLGFRCVREIE